MVSGFGRAVVALFIISSLGCSTEETGLAYVDAAADPTNQQQGIDPQPLPPKRDAKAPPDLAPDRPDAAVTPDAPVMADTAIDLAPDLGAPDLTPDKPPITNQPQGAECANDGECRTGHCAGGVCCESACNDGCSACTRARTGKANGTCARAQDLEGKACGKACGSVATMPAVVEKICSAGACVVPNAPKVLTSCQDANPCVVAFCDNNEARCVKTTCPQQGTCCCRSGNGQRACSQRNQCTGSKMCE
jgi:hypothetical protein